MIRALARGAGGSRVRPAVPAESSFARFTPSDHVVLHERLRLVEDLQVLGGDVNILAVGQGQLQTAFAGELDVEARAVEEDQVEADQAPERDQAANPRRPGGPAVPLPGNVEVVRPDVDRRRI